MRRTDAERMEDIHAAIARRLAYRDRLDSAERGEMAAKADDPLNPALLDAPNLKIARVSTSDRTPLVCGSAARSGY